MRFRTRILVPLIFCLLTTFSTAVAQYTCTSDEMDSAVNELTCYSPVVYVSLRAARDWALNLCFYSPSEVSCRRCLRRASSRISTGIKSLGRVGLVEKTVAREVRNALRNDEELICAHRDDPVQNDPPANETPIPDQNPVPPPDHMPSAASANNQFGAISPPRR